MEKQEGSLAPREKWQGCGAGARYRGERWGARRRAEVDPRLVAELVRRHGLAGGSILDAGCGAGRLRAALVGTGARWVGLDASLAMLAEVRALDAALTGARSASTGRDASADADVAPGRRRGQRDERVARVGCEAKAGGATLLAGDVLALPFRDGAFDAVVACRLLHHFRTREELAGVVAELARVARRVVIASFWDAGSLPALRRRVGWKQDEGPSGRVACSKRELEHVARAAGARVVEYRHVLRYLSQQTFAVLAVAQAGARGPARRTGEPAQLGAARRDGEPTQLGAAQRSGELTQRGAAQRAKERTRYGAAQRVRPQRESTGNGLALETRGEPEYVACVREVVLAAARDGARLSGPIALPELLALPALLTLDGKPGGAATRIGYLKGSPLAGKSRLRHGIRERILARAPPRLSEFENLEWLRRNGFRAPQPLAAGVLRARALGLVLYQFLLTEEVRGAATLERALAAAPAAAREACLAALGHQVARLHARGFVHRDLFPRNLLVVGDPARGEIWFLDAWRGGARLQSRGPDYDHACLLLGGALDFSDSERQAYFDAYFSERGRLGAKLDRARHLAAVARERRALVRRAGTQ